MILSKQQKNALIGGMLRLLVDPAFEDQIKKITVPGKKLIYGGTTKDASGNQIEPGKNYIISEKIPVRVNHRRRMLAIIEEAKNDDELETKMGAYLVKFARSKSEIIESIPQHLRTKKINLNERNN